MVPKPRRPPTGQSVMSYTLNWEADGVWVRYGGQSSIDEIAEVAKAIQGSARFDNLRFVLHDFSECNGISYALDLVEELAAVDCVACRSNPKLRVAVVADNPAVTALVEDYMSTGLNPAPMAIFHHIDEARAWLHGEGRPKADSATAAVPHPF